MRQSISLLILVTLLVLGGCATTAGTPDTGTGSLLVPLTCEVVKLRVDDRVASRCADRGSADCAESQAEARAVIDQFCAVIQGGAAVEDVARAAARAAAVDYLVNQVGFTSDGAALIVDELARAALRVER